MSEKKIEPTDAMVTSAHSAAAGRLMTDPMTYRRILRTALNHPDARGLFADEDDRPWEPLNGPVRVGDEVRQEHRGVTATGVVGRVDRVSSTEALYTAEGQLIGVSDVGTWYVRRPAPELPTTDGAVIVPAEGREFIEAEVAGQTFIAREAVVCQSDFGPANVLEGAWRRVDDGSRVGGQVSRDFITPGTWKLEGE